jgi:hypothetical protein
MQNWANFANRSISAQLPASEVTRPINSQKIAISVIDQVKRRKKSAHLCQRLFMPVTNVSAFPASIDSVCEQA